MSGSLESITTYYRHQRDYPRIFSFIKAHALLNCFNRQKLSEDTILANELDIDAGFELYKGIELSNEMGLSPYMLNMYDDVFMPILKPNEGVSRDDILKHYYKVKHKPMSPETLRSEIIPQLEAVGLIYQEEGDRRKMLVYPTVSHTYTSSSSFFWETFDVLKSQKQPEPDGTITVSESMLKQKLISSGKFMAGEAAQIIKDMITQGKLTRLEFDILVKNSQANISKID